MFSNDRNELRNFFFNAWHKHLNHQLLEPLEAQIVNIILLHPEYHDVFSNLDNQEKDFTEVNPFLHLSLHLAIHEQISTNRPNGINEIYQRLCLKYSSHSADHYMMDCLQEILSTAQANGKMPDEKFYLENLRKLL